MKPFFPRCLISNSDYISQLGLVFRHGTLVKVVPDDVNSRHDIYIGEREFAKSSVLQTKAVSRTTFQLYIV